MPTARHSAGSGVADNSAGNPIFYVFGGYDIDDEAGEHLFKSVEAYNLATNTWTTKAEAPSPRAAFNGVGKIGGKFYRPVAGTRRAMGFCDPSRCSCTTPTRIRGPGRPICLGRAVTACPA